jgi:hypothetical protein
VFGFRVDLPTCTRHCTAQGTSLTRFMIAC